MSGIGENGVGPGRGDVWGELGGRGEEGRMNW